MRWLESVSWLWVFFLLQALVSCLRVGFQQLFGQCISSLESKWERASILVRRLQGARRLSLWSDQSGHVSSVYWWRSAGSRGLRRQVAGCPQRKVGGKFLEKASWCGGIQMTPCPLHWAKLAYEGLLLRLWEFVLIHKIDCRCNFPLIFLRFFKVLLHCMKVLMVSCHNLVCLLN